jgi:hypothetical protein
MSAERDGLWTRIRSLGTKVEDEIYDFTEEDEEREAEPKGRNALITLINGFFSLWKSTTSNSAERTLGMLGFVGLFWFAIVDRGFGFRRWHVGIFAGTFAIIWFVPGIIASSWMLVANMGVSNLRQPRTWPLLIVYAMSGLIGFRGLFTDLARKRLHPIERDEQRPSRN